MSAARIIRGPIVVIAGLTIIVLGTLMVRAEVAWRRAESFRASGDLQSAVRSARGVFDMYVPGNPRLEDASALIWQAGEAREAAGDPAGALEAYRELRSAWIGAHPLGGSGGWIARCESRIARLMASQPVSVGKTAAPPSAEREKAYIAQMRAPVGPRGMWGSLAALGFAGWVGATIALIALGFGRDGRLRRRGLGWAGVIAAGYAVWLAGMMHA